MCLLVYVCVMTTSVSRQSIVCISFTDEILEHTHAPTLSFHPCVYVLKVNRTALAVVASFITWNEKPSVPYTIVYEFLMCLCSSAFACMLQTLSNRLCVCVHVVWHRKRKFLAINDIRNSGLMTTSTSQTRCFACYLAWRLVVLVARKFIKSLSQALLNCVNMKVHI